MHELRSAHLACGGGPRRRGGADRAPVLANGAAAGRAPHRAIHSRRGTAHRAAVANGVGLVAVDPPPSRRRAVGVRLRGRAPAAPRAGTRGRRGRVTRGRVDIDGGRQRDPSVAGRAPDRVRHSGAIGPPRLPAGARPDECARVAVGRAPRRASPRRRCPRRPGSHGAGDRVAAGARRSRFGDVATARSVGRAGASRPRRRRERSRRARMGASRGGRRPGGCCAWCGDTPGPRCPAHRSNAADARGFAVGQCRRHSRGVAGARRGACAAAACRAGFTGGNRRAARRRDRAVRAAVPAASGTGVAAVGRWRSRSYGARVRARMHSRGRDPR
jgi:hypothetical protein